MTDSGPRKRRGRRKAWLYLALFGSDTTEDGDEDASDASESAESGG